MHNDCIYNNKEHNGRLIHRENNIVRTYPVRRNEPNRRGAVVQPRMQISKLQTTSSEQKQACRPTVVKNYMLAEVFSFFLFFFVSFLFFFGNQTHKVTATQA